MVNPRNQAEAATWFGMPPRRAACALALLALILSSVVRRAGAEEQEITLPETLQEIYAEGTPKTLDDLRQMDAHQQELVKRVTRVTVGLQIGQTYGSGVIISPDGYVLTASHVAGRAGIPVRVTMPDGQNFRGQTLGMNKAVDAGLIKIEPDGKDEQPIEWDYARMGDAAQMKPGSWCLALGHPGGYQRGRLPVARFGRVLKNTSSELETDCKLVGGDSGGPLFDMQGNVVGIHSRIGNKLTKNLHVPVDVYRHDWERLVRGATWGSWDSLVSGPRRPVIGVLGGESDEPRVTQVLPASPAERAGIQPGDLIVEFDGEEVAKFDTLKALVSQRTPGDEVKVNVRRGDETLVLSLVIGEIASQ